ncbi:MAG: isochorismatase family protein [Planctomycetia bacterium]|nr:isochorismatase family protein [Planctomycetia bacterium]
MLQGPLVFVDVDTQRDFLEPDGALYVPGSEGILGNLARLTGFARRHAIPVLATACSHSHDDPEIARFGPHCMAGTPGERRVSATARDGGTVLGPSGRYSGSIPAHLTIQKRELDVFRHPEADLVVALYQRDRPTFVVYGVATEYCVAAAVLGLIDRGGKVAVVADAVRAIDAGREADVLTGFTRRGTLLTLTDVVCDEDSISP